MGPRSSLKNLNISRERKTRHRWLYLCIHAALVFAYAANICGAADAKTAMSPYTREWWGLEQGFPGGPVYAIAQTPDGYLWIGTEKGLVRFDGLNFSLLQPSDSGIFPAGPILSLAVDGEGNLWVRPRGPRLLRYRDGKFSDVLADLKLRESEITAMCVGENGEILFSGLVNGTMRYSGGKFVTLASVTELPKLIISLAEAVDGKVWLGTKDAGLYYLNHGRVSAVSTGLPDTKVNSLLANRGEVWIGTDKGVVHWKGTSPAEASHVLDDIQGLVMIRDRDSNIWVATPTASRESMPEEILRLTAAIIRQQAQ